MDDDSYLDLAGENYVVLLDRSSNVAEQLRVVERQAHQYDVVVHLHRCHPNSSKQDGYHVFDYSQLQS